MTDYLRPKLAHCHGNW